MVLTSTTFKIKEALAVRRCWASQTQQNQGEDLLVLKK